MMIVSKLNRNSSTILLTLGEYWGTLQWCTSSVMLKICRKARRTYDHLIRLQSKSNYARYGWYQGHRRHRRWNCRWRWVFGNPAIHSLEMPVMWEPDETDRKCEARTSHTKREIGSELRRFLNRNLRLTSGLQFWSWKWVIEISLKYHTYREQWKWNSPFSDQNEVGQSVNDYSAAALLDHIGKYAESWGKTAVTSWEYVYVRAFRPCYVGRRMDSKLDIFTIEVERRELDLFEGATEM